MDSKAVGRRGLQGELYEDLWGKKLFSPVTDVLARKVSRCTPREWGNLPVAGTDLGKDGLSKWFK